MTNTTDPTDDYRSSWICPEHPFYHDWQKGLQCRACGATRTASEAVVSVLASARGCSEEAAEALRDALVAETAANVVPLALVRMFPHGEAAHLAARILAHADVLGDALDALVEPASDGAVTLDSRAVTEVRDMVNDFRHLVVEEERETAEYLKSTGGSRVWDAPLSGTSCRSLVTSIADSFLFAKDPQDGVAWWQAARERVFAVGKQYEQVWKDDTTFYKFMKTARRAGEQPTT